MCLALVACSRLAHAQEPEAARFGFDYQSSAELGCPAAEEVRRAIARQLEYEPFAPTGTATEHGVRIVIDRAASGLEARMTWVDREGVSEGERRLASQGTDCAELGRGVVFAVAVQIQLRASGAAASAEPAPSPPAPSSPHPPAPPLRARAPAAPRPAERLLLVGVGAGAARGWLPSFTPRLNLVGAVSSGRAWLGASLGVSLPARHEQTDGTGIDAWTLDASLFPCVRTPPLGWCLAGMVGRLKLHGYGVDRPLRPSSTLAAFGGRVEALWPAFRSWGVLIHAQALATLTPYDAVLNGVTVWTTDPVYVGAGVDFVVTLR